MVDTQAGKQNLQRHSSLHCYFYSMVRGVVRMCCRCTAYISAHQSTVLTAAVYTAIAFSSCCIKDVLTKYRDCHCMTMSTAFTRGLDTHAPALTQRARGQQESILTMRSSLWESPGPGDSHIRSSPTHFAFRTSGNKCIWVVSFVLDCAFCGFPLSPSFLVVKKAYGRENHYPQSMICIVAAVGTRMYLQQGEQKSLR